MARGLEPCRSTADCARQQRAHEIDFRILGSEMQFVEVELDSGESAVAEAGSMMYMTPGIQMETVFGDGSGQQRSGVMGALLGAGKRLLTGESLFMTVFTNGGGGKQQVRSRAVPEKSSRWISRHWEGIRCQKGSLFLCRSRISTSSRSAQIGVGLFGVKPHQQKLEGDVSASARRGRCIRRSAAGQTLRGIAAVSSHALP